MRGEEVCGGRQNGPHIERCYLDLWWWLLWNVNRCLIRMLHMWNVCNNKTYAHKCKNLNKILASWIQFSSVAQLCPTLLPHELQHSRIPCPSPIPGACSNSSPSSRWCHPTISSSVVPFSPDLQYFPKSGSFPVSWFFSSGVQSIRASASASVLPMNIQD